MMKAAADQQRWFAIDVAADPSAAEAIEYAFNSLDSLGTEIGGMPKDRRETVTVIGYFGALPDGEIMEDEIRYALQIYGLNEEAVVSIVRREVQNEDWLAEWKKHWKPTTVGRFVIAPPWENVDDSQKIVIRIEPNMAFGTGTHETTQLCLRAIEANYHPGDSFLDVGTGTGILAIAAAKLATERIENAEGVAAGSGSRILETDPSSVLSVTTVARILACDTDSDAVKIAKENATMNGVENIEFHDGPLVSDAASFDFVCANLTLDVILPMLRLLLEKTRKTLVLSGILAEQEDSVTTALKGLNVADFRIDRSGEWIAVTASQNRER
jgi:ribosomal protein L11 methyltransferase